jgi:hypothetical protein
MFLGIIAAEKSAEMASLSSSMYAAFLFLSLVEWVIAITSTQSFFPIIAFAVLLALETLVNASILRGLVGKDDELGAVDSFRRFVAVGMVERYNCCRNYVRIF